MCAVGICEKAKVIDLTQRHGTTSSLTEARLMSTLHDKDLYLYYFVRQFAGRTLVFTNSKDCVRRLNSVFSLLHCYPLALHADMQQRQRLRNLDRFKSKRSFSCHYSSLLPLVQSVSTQHTVHCVPLVQSVSTWCLVCRYSSLLARCSVCH